MVIDDNSGLSRENRVSPAALAKAMKLVVNEPRFRSLLLGLPVGGVSGTLYDRFHHAHALNVLDEGSCGPRPAACAT